MKVKIYYEDTDMGGIVYHTNYIKYCERARSELFFKNGKSPHSEDGFFVIKKILNADFIKPAKFGDELHVKSKLTKMKNTSCVIHQSIYIKEEKIFEMDAVLVYVQNMAPKKIPDELKEFFRQNIF